MTRKQGWRCLAAGFLATPPSKGHRQTSHLANGSHCCTFPFQVSPPLLHNWHQWTGRDHNWGELSFSLKLDLGNHWFSRCYWIPAPISPSQHSQWWGIINSSAASGAAKIPHSCNKNSGIIASANEIRYLVIISPRSWIHQLRFPLPIVILLSIRK